MHCLSHYSFPSFPPGLSLYIICLSLSKPQGPYLLSPDRCFKPTLSYSLYFTGQEWTEVSSSALRGVGLATHLPVHTCSSWAASHLHQSKQQHWVQPSQSPESEALRLSSLRFVVRTVRVQVRLAWHVPNWPCGRAHSCFEFDLGRIV